MLTEREKKVLRDYEKQLAMPKWKYVFLYGVLAWGVTVGIVFSAVNLLMRKAPLSEMLQGELWVYLIGFPVGGILFGLFMRRLLPRQIKRLKEKEMQP